MRIILESVRERGKKSEARMGISSSWNEEETVLGIMSIRASKNIFSSYEL